jgi:large subunit ribosomal protein L34e
MVAPNKRSRSKRRVFVKTPSGKVVKHYRARKPNQGRCPVTGEVIKGVPRVSAAKMHNMAKSKKRPQRPFGGALSSRAARRIIIDETRALAQLE